MLEKIKKYKFVLLFTIFVLVLLINNKANASTGVSFSYNNKTYNAQFPQDFKHYIVTYCSDGNFWLNATNNSNAIKSYYRTSSVGHYLTFTDSGSNVRLSPEYRYYSKDCINWTLRDSGFDGLVRNSIVSYCISNINVYDFSDNLLCPATSELPPPFYLEYNESLNSYVIYSNWYGIVDSELYSHQHYYQNNPVTSPTEFIYETRKFNGWFNMEGNDNEIGPGLEFNEEIEVTPMDVNKVKWRVGLQIVDYGTYYFCHYLPLSDNKDYEIIRFVINENGNSYTETLDKNNYNTWINKTNIDTTIDNELKENINTQNSYDYFKVFYNEGYENAYIYTNWFLSDSQYNYVVDYSLDNLNWNDDMNIEEYTSNYDYFRYTLDVFKNGTYYIRLRTYDTQNDNSLSSTKIMQIKIRSIGVTDYRSDDTDVEYRLKNNRIYKFLKTNLGALFYPIDLLFDFLTRLDRIDDTQPTITVPTVREYFTNAVIINGFTYNLNSVLENETFAQVYNIYLNFVDFILFIAISYHLYKILKEFINFGGGII